MVNLFVIYIIYIIYIFDPVNVKKHIEKMSMPQGVPG